MSVISQEAILAGILAEIPLFRKIEEDKIRNALTLTSDYRIVKVPKKSGGYRTLYIPPDSLKKIQKRILRRLFQKMFKVYWVGLYGIYKGTSYVEHTKKHKDAKWVFQFDLADAFPSVNISSLKEILQKEFLGEMKAFEFSVSRVRYTLKRLEKAKEENDKCEIDFMEDYLKTWKKEVSASVFSPTVLPELMIFKEGDEWTLPQKEEISQGLANLIIELTTFQRILPQGTPTAPFLFYLALSKKGLFGKLQSICSVICPDGQDRYGFRVSAYIDNFVISAQKPIRNQEELFKTVEEFGFKINPKKTRHQGTIYGAPLITGLRITTNDDEKGKVVLPKRKIRRWRGLIHRAIFEPDLRPKVKGLIASLKPIYGDRSISDWEYFSRHSTFPREPILPPQLEKPYRKLLQVIEQEGV